MAAVFVSIGSNIDRKRYISNALDELSAIFGKVRLSSVYESEAVGFDGDNFYNLVAHFETRLSIAQLSMTLKQIEDKNGRCRQGPKFSGRTLDIDILTYDDRVGIIDGVQLPRDEIVQNAFVLLPLAEIAGTELHPELKQSYAELWQQYDKEKQQLWAVEFVWRGATLPAVV
ncbi:MAG: 2-amino-4-hydroxy-6-hydroxymethyldihydropteridine diphosphokinase [Neptuniibacter caesariensis]|uniref:2-amino-4-hydroxy-6-hydroxymethyldihydropteridine diphosphokinase n=1 Tax=Neptuniibacter caesariensis TaxID=207954 RepID=A0A2G6JN75_NEPCE|nr:MAG: 2-amino-4-hydroxy-6-hydroxymethyldihydropteridine diphosphokinase [Neptuniibacter caesariensis]